MRVQTRKRQHQSGKFLGAGEIELYYQSWHPVLPPRAVLVIVHGLGAHSGIFKQLAEFLCDRQITVYALDLRGHGRSEGQRGHINSWSEFRQDLNAFIQLVSTKEPTLPLYLLGQSLGGTISLDYALRYGNQRHKNKLQGLILFSPALKVKTKLLKKISGRLFSRLLPRFTVNTDSQARTFSCDPQMVAKAICDPLRHTKASARLATEFWQSAAWIEAHADSLKIPLLILHGGADQVTLPKPLIKFFANIALADKERIEYAQRHHELQNDLECRTVFADLENWIERHLEARLSS